MFTIEELVSSAFSGESLDLEATELAGMTNVVSMQVDSLLLQYVAGPDNVRLLPNRPAEMLSRCISDLAINQREIQKGRIMSFINSSLGTSRVTILGASLIYHRQPLTCDLSVSSLFSQRYQS